MNRLCSFLGFTLSLLVAFGMVLLGSEVIRLVQISVDAVGRM